MKFKRTLLATASILLAGTSQSATPSNGEAWQLSLMTKESVTEAPHHGQQSKNIFKASRAPLHGQGGLRYNSLQSDDDKKKEDSSRFEANVQLFLGRSFNNGLRFFSELKIRHNLPKEMIEQGQAIKGASELKQAYIQYDLNDRHSVTGGFFPTPIGITAPSTFYRTKPNPVMTNIIPKTTQKSGVMFSGKITEGFGYDASATFELNKAKAQDIEVKAYAYTGRIKWTGIPGLELAATMQYRNNNDQDDVQSRTLFETHAVFQRGNFGLSALYVTLNPNGSNPSPLNTDKTGWYLEPSYKISEHFGLFASYNRWSYGVDESSNAENKQIDLGVNWWPREDVVIKAIYRKQDTSEEESVRDNGFDVGLNYQF